MPRPQKTVWDLEAQGYLARAFETNDRMEAIDQLQVLTDVLLTRGQISQQMALWTSPYSLVGYFMDNVWSRAQSLPRLFDRAAPSSGDMSPDEWTRAVNRAASTARSEIADGLRGVRDANSVGFYWSIKDEYQDKVVSRVSVVFHLPRPHRREWGGELSVFGVGKIVAAETSWTTVDRELGSVLLGPVAGWTRLHNYNYYRDIAP